MASKVKKDNKRQDSEIKELNEKVSEVESKTSEISENDKKQDEALNTISNVVSENKQSIDSQNQHILNNDKRDDEQQRQIDENLLNLAQFKNEKNEQDAQQNISIERLKQNVYQSHLNTAENYSNITSIQKLIYEKDEQINELFKKNVRLLDRVNRLKLIVEIALGVSVASLITSIINFIC